MSRKKILVICIILCLIASIAVFVIYKIKKSEDPRLHQSWGYHTNVICEVSEIVDRKDNQYFPNGRLDFYDIKAKVLLSRNQDFVVDGEGFEIRYSRYWNVSYLDPPMLIEGDIIVFEYRGESRFPIKEGNVSFATGSIYYGSVKRLNDISFSYPEGKVNDLIEKMNDTYRLLPEGDIDEMIFEPLSGQEGYSITDKDLIEVVREYLNSLELEPASVEYSEAYGGWNCYLTFVYSNGREEKIVYFDDVYVRNARRSWGRIKNSGNEKLKDILESMKNP